MKMINKLHWIDKESIMRFILASQDAEDGGIADRPEDMVITYLFIKNMSLSRIHFTHSMVSQD